MARLLLWLVLLWLALRAIRRLVDGVKQGMTTGSAAPPRPPVGLARDPICGTFVVPSRSLSSGSGADTHFFCSEACRQAWASR